MGAGRREVDKQQTCAHAPRSIPLSTRRPASSRCHRACSATSSLKAAASASPSHEASQYAMCEAMSAAQQSLAGAWAGTRAGGGDLCVQPVQGGGRHVCRSTYRVEGGTCAGWDPLGISRRDHQPRQFLPRWYQGSTCATMMDGTCDGRHLVIAAPEGAETGGQAWPNCLWCSQTVPAINRHLSCREWP